MIRLQQIWQRQWWHLSSRELSINFALLQWHALATHTTIPILGHTTITIMVTTHLYPLHAFVQHNECNTHTHTHTTIQFYNYCLIEFLPICLRSTYINRNRLRPHIIFIIICLSFVSVFLFYFSCFFSYNFCCRSHEESVRICIWSANIPIDRNDGHVRSLLPSPAVWFLRID